MRDSHRRSVDKPATDTRSYEQLKADFEQLKKDYAWLTAAMEECSSAICSEFAPFHPPALVDPETLAMVSDIGAPVCSPVDVLADLEHEREDHARDMLRSVRDNEQTGFAVDAISCLT